MVWLEINMTAKYVRGHLRRKVVFILAGVRYLLFQGGRQRGGSFGHTRLIKEWRGKGREMVRGPEAQFDDGLLVRGLPHSKRIRVGQETVRAVCNTVAIRKQREGIALPSTTHLWKKSERRVWLSRERHGSAMASRRKYPRGSLRVTSP